MRKFWIAALPLAFFVAGEASAQRALTPGEFFTGLTETGAEVMATQAREANPGATVEMTFDIGLGTWTLDVRESHDSVTQ
ncbi:hypothetical protein [Elioraea sp.]|uniref:hypothetical protein n=1 Tax=Elioraea sp. TaxID=2185103 RepID=UPI0025C3DCAD|nr:hypothetical protein [Elioraea sp.]